jgi:aryl-phospho-beta-D-glucosidase BglC (GH1 family)
MDNYSISDPKIMIIKSKGSIMKISFSLLLVYLLLFSLFCDKQPVAAEIETDIIYTPHEAIEQMMRGINLGNTLEPDTEGGWNNGPVQEYYFDDYQSAGFQCVRIPVKWGSHTSESSPFDINLSWLNRVEEVVDWGLERGLFIIINGHHEGWLKDDYSLLNITRYENIWTQISERFKDKSHRLLFEMINEPHGLTDEQTNDLNFRILPIIRETNPTRIK